MMNIYRFFISLPTIFMLVFFPMQTGTRLALTVASSTNGCVTSSPSPATYTVKLCFTSPQNGSSLSGNAEVTVTATITPKTSGVQRMVYYLNGAYLLTDYQSPYTFTLPTTHWVDGSYSLAVEALMRSGFTTQRANLTVNFANGIKTPPVNSNQFQPTSGTTPANGAPFVVAATGDGASGEANETGVVKLLTSIKPNLFLYLGDVYEKGSYTEFYNWYGPSGNNYSSLRSITDPTIGNHEYTSGSPQGYFDYWDNIPNYYSFDAGGWHFIDLNSNGSYVGVTSKSAQYQWLAADLAAHPQVCTIVYYHEPLFNIGPEGVDSAMASIWALVAQHHVPIVLNGHDHDYQRWIPLNGQGQPDPNGVTEFIAGGGGHGLQTFNKTDSRVAYSNDANPTTFGALKLELSSSGAAFSYINSRGTTLDSGVVPCHLSTQVAQPTNVPTAITAAPSSVSMGISVAVANEFQVDLRWSAPSDKSKTGGYVIYRDGAVLAKVPADVLTYTDATAMPGVSYNYCVNVNDLGGNKLAASPQVNVATPDY
jgi:hypothetical protein